MADETQDQAGQRIEGSQLNVAGDATIEHLGDRIDTGGGDYVGRDKVINYYVESQTIVAAEALQKIEDMPPKEGDPPYKGLAYFTEKDQDYYFGRETLSDQLVARLQETRFLTLIGASGSGKSSLLRAGIIPRLRQRNWQIHVVIAGARPLAALANSLTRDDLDPEIGEKMVRALASNADTLLNTGDKLAARADAERLLLAVDQFEALFTQCKDQEQQEAFVANLVTVAQAQGMTTVLLNMRADFYNRISAYPALTDLVSQQQEYVKPLAEDDLVRVIAGPAKRGGWQILEGLTETIVDDVGREPGSLPLLSHALLETWYRRRDTVMTLSGYRDAEGVSGAISKTAEATLKRLEKDGIPVPIVKHIFLSLTELSEGAEDTRRVASREEVLRYDADPETINQVIDSLADARLITVDKDEVQVAHEALIRRWQRLEGWIAENRERLSFFRRLQRAAEVWESTERQDDYLYRGSQLTQAESRIEGYSSWQLAPLQADFIEASKELAAKEEERAQEIERTGFENALLLYGFAGIGGALGVSLAALLIAVTSEIAEFLAVLYILFGLVFGAATGVLYVAVFDRWVSGVKEGPNWQAWLRGIVSGAAAFAVALWWLTTPFGGALPGITLGVIWGTVAGAGRLWIQRSERDKRYTIPLVSFLAGLVLAIVYIIAQGLLPQFFGGELARVPAWVMLVSGVLVPLIILVADEYAAGYFNAKRKQ